MNDTTMNTNYAAVLADLERKRSELDSAIAAIRAVIGATGGATSSVAGEQPKTLSSTPLGTMHGSVQLRSDAFIGLSIAEASKKYLGMVKAPVSTASLIEALSKGGIPTPAYNTVYAVLSRQERQSGDIFKLLHTKEWALPEWYGGKIPKQRKATSTTEEASEASE
jgi:hypothetical protein